MNPTSESAPHVPTTQERDLEKNIEKHETEVSIDEHGSTASPVPTPHIPVPNKFHRFNSRIEALGGLEARGIVRVEENERHEISWLRYIHMAIMWFSANISANNLAVGLLGPQLFGLSFLDSAMCAFGGIIVGSAVTAYMSTWGAQSGNRTMVSETAYHRLGIRLTRTKIVARFFMGYWPAKLTCILNMILMIGYGVIDAIIAGQILSAVSGGSMTIVVGIVVTALISWVVALFGMGPFHIYER